MHLEVTCQTPLAFVTDIRRVDLFATAQKFEIAFSTVHRHSNRAMILDRPATLSSDTSHAGPSDLDQKQIQLALLVHFCFKS